LREERVKLKLYHRLGKEPWSEGYDEYRNNYIEKTFTDAGVMESLKNNSELPPEYGFRLDERVV